MNNLLNMKIIFASNNKNKIKEINELLNNKFEIISLTEAGITEDIAEPYFTFQENALAKAQYVFDKTGLPTFSEDSGLIVPSLNGEPGVLSARYAGLQKSDSDNNAKLLASLTADHDRAAYYNTTICYIDADKTIHYFEGQCHGSIATQLEGNGGFGYDPLFIPKGYESTFGTLDPNIKKAISHRSKATQLLIAHLTHLND